MAVAVAVPYLDLRADLEVLGVRIEMDIEQLTQRLVLMPYQKKLSGHL